MKTKQVFKLFWAWQDTKEEAWLREMSNQGWHFKSVSNPGIFTFIKGEPKDYVYRLDYITKTDDRDSYLQLFEDAGWDYMGMMNSWQYFRQEAVDGEDLHIFSDGTSKAQKYQRILLAMVIIFPICLPGILYLSKAEGDIYQVAAVILSVGLIGYVYMMANLLGRITTLLKK